MNEFGNTERPGGDRGMSGDVRVTIGTIGWLLLIGGVLAMSYPELGWPFTMLAVGIGFVIGSSLHNLRRGRGPRSR
jgi:hypothetical protein